MLALAAYDSSSEEEEATSPRPATVTPAAVAKANLKRKAPVATNSKGKKILPASLLPPEIQAALARGADLDSDSDSDAPVVKRTTKGATLMSRLPAPSNDAADAVKEQVQRVQPRIAAKFNAADSDSEDDASNRKAAAATRQPELDSVQPQTEEEEEEPSEEGAEAEDEVERSHAQQFAASSSTAQSSSVLFSVHEDDIEKRSRQVRVQQPPIPSIRTHVAAAAPVQAAPVQAAPVQAAPVQAAPSPQLASLPPQQFHQPYLENTNDAYAANTQYMSAAAAGGDHYSQAYAHPQLQQYAAPDAAYSAYAHLHAQPPAAADSSGHGKSARRRDRELQQQLLAGNTAVLADAPMRTVQATGRDWDPVKYSDRAKQEAQVMAAYNIGGQQGQNTGYMQPTRTMNRRHQITSLAYAAAQMEIQLLDGRGQQSKTKAQTQAKYGW